MFKKVKLLLASKISINITIIVPAAAEIESTVVPRTSIISKPIIVRKSDFRFASDKKVEQNGKITEFYYTEQYTKGKWSWVNHSGSVNKNAAMDLHLLLLEKTTLGPIETKTIHWEGLDKETTKTWVALQKQ